MINWYDALLRVNIKSTATDVTNRKGQAKVTDVTVNAKDKRG